MFPDLRDAGAKPEGRLPELGPDLVVDPLLADLGRRGERRRQLADLMLDFCRNGDHGAPTR